MSSDPDALSTMGGELAAIMRDVRDRQDDRVREGAGCWAPGPNHRPPPATAVDLERRQRQRFDAFERWGVPYREALLVIGASPSGERFFVTDAVRHAQEFLEEAAGGKKNILVLAGLVGVGKTVASVYLMEAADPPLLYGRTWREFNEPRFCQITELMAMGVYDYEKDEKKRQQRRRIAETKVLVLDEIGVEHQDKAGLHLVLLDWVLNRRYGAPGYTVITTNLGAEAFGEQYGERIYDRLRKNAVWCDIDHGSLRR